MTLDDRIRSAVIDLHQAGTAIAAGQLPSRAVVIRRRVLVAALAAVVAAIVLVMVPNVLRQLGIQQIETADQPKTKEASRDATGKGGGQTTEGGGPGSGGRRAPGGSEGSSKDSRSGGSLPASSIPQGFEIAFSRQAAGVWDIYLMNAEGSDLRQLRGGVQPEWSPDARLIAFTDNFMGGDIQLMNADGSGSRNLGAKGSSPTWSPDGGWLAFNRECDAQFGGPCEQPDGTKKDCGPECGIGVVARDGTGVRRLGNGIGPDWGPDGRIIFTDGMPSGACLNPNGVGSCGLPMWVMNPDGSGRTRLPVDNAFSPTWSHDGRRIAYYTPTDGVFVANSDGTGIVKVAPAGYQEPSWSPDGLWLAVTGYKPDNDRCAPTTSCVHNIYLRGIDGTTERRLTFSNNDVNPAFSPRR